MMSPEVTVEAVKTRQVTPPRGAWCLRCSTSNGHAISPCPFIHFQGRKSGVSKRTHPGWPGTASPSLFSPRWLRPPAPPSRAHGHGTAPAHCGLASPSSCPTRSVDATAALSGGHGAEDASWGDLAVHSRRACLPRGVRTGAQELVQNWIESPGDVHRQDEGVPKTPWLSGERSASSGTAHWTQKAPACPPPPLPGEPGAHACTRG